MIYRTSAWCIFEYENGCDSTRPGFALYQRKDESLDAI
jgi:hypothetical protein